MGAQSDYVIFEAPNEKAALTRGKQIMQDRCYEYGHDPYGGHIGIASGIVVYKTPKPVTEKKADAIVFGNEANDWNGAAQKWGPAVLVRIKNKGSRKAKWFMGAMCAS